MDNRGQIGGDVFPWQRKLRLVIIILGVVVMVGVAMSLPMYPEVEGTVASITCRDVGSEPWLVMLHGHPGEFFWSNERPGFEVGEEVIMFIDAGFDYSEIKSWIYPWEDVRCG